MSFIHEDLPVPFDAMVHNSFFQDLDKSVKGFTPVEVFEVTSYTESVPTFTVRDPTTGGTFHDLPPHAITFAQVESLLEPEEGSYNDCPDEHIVAYATDYASMNGRAYVFLKRDGELVRLTGRYRFTLDWYEDNLVLHGIQLDSGHLTLQPPHKVLFNAPGEDPRLPTWKKFHHTWSVGR
jgi:hypothetical protein